MLIYAVSVGVGLSVPFILIAFNLDRAGSMLKHLRYAFRHRTKPVVLYYRFYQRTLLAVAITAVVVAILVPVWTSHLASGVKLAVTVTIAVLAVIGVMGAAFLYYWRRGKAWDKYSSTSADIVD